MPVSINRNLLPKELIRLNMLVCLLCALASVCTQAYAQAPYTFTTFSVPNSTYTNPYAISEGGYVTGRYGLADGYAGFVRTPSGTIGTISFPGARTTAAGGMNRFGVIAGNYGNAVSPVGGFFYYKGAYGNAVIDGQPAFVIDSNDYGYYVGNYGGPTAVTGFVASPSGEVTVLQYPGACCTYPYWIKNDGEVAGAYQDQIGGLHAFVWNARSGYRTISIPGVPKAQIFDINAHGIMVGTYINGSTVRGFVYQKGIFRIVEPPGANGSSISAIDNKGQLVGHYTVPGSTSMGFIATPVR